MLARATGGAVGWPDHGCGARRHHGRRKGHEAQRRAKAGEPPRDTRNQRDGGKTRQRRGADIRRQEIGDGHVRKTPPVFFVTSATIFAATASISWSVRVFSRGCIVTAIATDFLSGSMPLPS